MHQPWHPELTALPPPTHTHTYTARPPRSLQQQAVVAAAQGRQGPHQQRQALRLKGAQLRPRGVAQQAEEGVGGRVAQGGVGPGNVGQRLRGWGGGQQGREGWVAFTVEGEALARLAGCIKPEQQVGPLRRRLTQRSARAEPV